MYVSYWIPDEYQCETYIKYWFKQPDYNKTAQKLMEKHGVEEIIMCEFRKL